MKWATIAGVSENLRNQCGTCDVGFDKLFSNTCIIQVLGTGEKNGESNNFVGRYYVAEQMKRVKLQIKCMLNENFHLRARKKCLSKFGF